MTPVTQLPGQRWFARLRNPAVRIGVMTGCYLSVVLGGWMVVANRVPWPASLAGIRNLAAAALTAMLVLLPIARFLRSPGQLLFAGLLGWGVNTCTYLVLGLFFDRLFSRMRPFNFFMLGAVVYGVVAATAWVTSLMLAARHHPIAAARRHPY